MTDRLGEALRLYDKWGATFLDEAAITAPIVAAARLVADARQPDYEAARDVEITEFDGRSYVRSTVDHALSPDEVRAIVNAVLGVEPSQQVKVVIVYD